MNSGRKTTSSEQPIDPPPESPSSKNTPSAYDEWFLEIVPLTTSVLILGGCLVVFTISQKLDKAARALRERSTSFMR
ncbi:hypothetical protein KBB27_02360 [Patescibacteria group bacterium]|nr:hypothetical protein [Patescibacteria group bacterium]